MAEHAKSQLCTTLNKNNFFPTESSRILMPQIKDELRNKVAEDIPRNTTPNTKRLFWFKKKRYKEGKPLPQKWGYGKLWRHASKLSRKRSRKLQLNYPIKADLWTDMDAHFNAVNQIWIKFYNLMPFFAASGIVPGSVQCWNFSMERKNWNGVEWCNRASDIELRAGQWVFSTH